MSKGASIGFPHCTVGDIGIDIYLDDSDSHANVANMFCKSHSYKSGYVVKRRYGLGYRRYEASQVCVKMECLSGASSFEDCR